MPVDDVTAMTAADGREAAALSSACAWNQRRGVKPSAIDSTRGMALVSQLGDKIAATAQRALARR